MIKLANGAKVHLALIDPRPSPGMKPNGVVLAETEGSWVTWNIYYDDGLHEDMTIWEAETGHYFQKNLAGARGLAELDFGTRLAALLPYDCWQGANRDR